MTQDPFSHRFYAIERAARLVFEPSQPEPLSIGECFALIEGAWEVLGIRPTLPIYISDGEPGLKTGQCVAYPTHYEIRLPLARRRPWCVLHEVAHTVTRDGHGPQFEAVVFALWSSPLCGWPRHELDAMAQTTGFAPSTLQ